MPKLLHRLDSFAIATARSGSLIIICYFVGDFELGNHFVIRDIV